MAVLETAVRLVVAPDLTRPSRLEGPHDPCLTPLVPPLRGSSSAGCAVSAFEAIETRYSTAGQNGTPT